MAEFDPTGYFAKRYGNTEVNKLDAVSQAYEEKLAGLNVYHASKATANYKAPEVPNSSSWVSKAGMDPNGLVGGAVNLAASVGSGVTRKIGQLASLPFDAIAIADASRLDDGDSLAYARYQQGIATAEDIQRLNTPKSGMLTPLQLFNSTQETQKAGKAITDFMDTSKIVHSGKRDRLANELGDNFQGAWDTTKEGAAKFMAGNVFSGAVDVVSGVSRLGGNAAHALVTQPGAVTEYAFENAPDLLLGGVAGKVGKAALTASNVGYGTQMYQKGTQDYQDANDGALPPVAQRQDMGLHAAAAVGAEQFGDVMQLAGMKLAKKGVDEITRTGFKESLKNINKAGAKGFASEAPTEAFQTYAEGEASLKPASDKDIYIGGVIGGATGHALTAGGRALAELTKATPEHAKQRVEDQQARVDHVKAMETNDTSAYLDASKKTYDPVKAIEVHIGNSQQADTTPEAKQENLTKANQILTDLEEKADAIRENVASASPESIAVQQTNISRMKAALAKKDPADTAGIEGLTDAIAEMESQFKEASDPKWLKTEEVKLRTLERQIAAARNAKTGLHTLVEPNAADVDSDIELADTVHPAEDTEAVASANAAVGRILTLSMASPHRITPEAAKRLADNPDNALTPEQRDYFRVFSEARIAENRMKTGSQVEQEIYNGSNVPGKQRQMGIASYNTQMSEALAAGNEKTAARLLAGLTKFAANHQDKAATAQKAFETVKGRQPQIIFNAAEGKWGISPETKSDAWMKTNGGFTLSTPEKSIAQFKTEADALNKSTAALKAAYGLKFGKPAVASVHPSGASTNPIQKTDPSISVDSQNSRRESTVDLVKVVDSSKPVEPVNSTGDSSQLQSKVDSTVDPVVASTPATPVAEHTPVTKPSSRTKKVPSLEGKLGKDSEPLVEGGKPFKTRREAKKAKKLQPLMRVVSVEGGYALAPKTERQLAAEAIAIQRLKLPRTTTEGKPEAWHEIVARWGGLKRSTTAGEMNIERNQRIGNRWLYASEGKGLTGDKIREMFEEREWIEEGMTESAVIQMIKDSVNDPAYPPGTDYSLLHPEATYEDYLAAERAAREAGENSTNALEELGFILKDMVDAGYARASEEIQEEVAALLHYAETNEIDTDFINQLSEEHINDENPDTYYQKVHAALITKLTEAIERSLGNSSEDVGIEGHTGIPEEEVTDEEDGEPTSAAESVNPADSAGKLVALQNKSPEGTAYTARNLLADFTVQVGQRVSEVAARPLVAVKDFLAQWEAGTINISDFLEDKGESLSTVQEKALTAFKELATKWNDLFQQMFVKKEDTQYHHQDLMQFLVQELGEGIFDFEENVKTAMSLAAFKAIVDAAEASPVASPKQINKLLLRADDHEITNEEVGTLSRVGVRENVWRNAVGKTVVQALGIKALGDAPLDLIPRLESAFGAYIQKMLQDQGMLTQTAVAASLMTKFMATSSKKRTDVKKQGGDTQFVRLAWVKDKKGQEVLPKHIQKVVNTYTGSRNILDKVFSVEASQVPPSLTPIPFAQKTTGGTQEGIPKNIRESAEDHQKKPLFMRNDMLMLLHKLSPDAIATIAGVVDLENRKTHISNRTALEASNNGLHRDIKNYFEVVGLMTDTGEAITTLPFFLTEDAWVNQRVGSGTSMFSLQSSKFQRGTAYHESWKGDVDMTDPDAFNHFKLRVLEGMGVKTDQKSSEQVLKGFDALFDPRHKQNTTKNSKDNAAKVSKAIDVLVATVINEKAMSYEMEQAFVAGVQAAGNEGTHTVASLLAMAQMRHTLAQKENNTVIKDVILPGEVDGVANGPVFTQILMGAAKSSGEMLQKMVRGGFFSELDEEQQYNLWKGTPGNLDQYEEVARKIVENINVLIAADNANSLRNDTVPTIGKFYGAIQSFTGTLEKGGKVQKHGRTVVKTTLTPLMFGSSVETSLTRMADKFIEDIVTRIEAVANGEGALDDSAANIIADINTLLEGHQVAKMDSRLSLEQLLEYDFTANKSQLAALKATFGSTLGRAVRTTLKENFAEYLIQKDHFTRSLGLSFDLFDSVFQGIRAEYVQELIQAEKDKPGTGIAVDGAGNPLHDLTRPQLRILEKRLAKLKPMMHTTNSKLEGNIQNGVFLGKHTSQTSSKKTYRSVVNVAPRFNQGKKTVWTQATEASFEAGGVTGLSQGTHSFDSGVMSDSRMGKEVIGVHDAAIVGLAGYFDIAKSLNQNTFKHLLNYSPMGEAFNALARMVGSLDAFIKEGNLTPGALANLNAMLEKYAEDQKVPADKVLEHMLTSGKMQAYKADSIKFGFLAQITSVDQYAAEGGNYLVKPEERAAAQANLEGLSEVVPAKLLEKAAAVTKAILGNTQEAAVVTKEDTSLDSMEDLESSVDLDTLPVLETRQLLGMLIRTAPRLRDKATRVLNAMNATNSSLGKALATTLSAYYREEVSAALAALYAKKYDPKAKTGNNKFAGKLLEGGSKPAIESDPQLVQYFNRASDVRVDRVLAMLETRLKEREQTPEVKGQRVLLQQLAKLAKPKLQVTMVTPSTYDTFIMNKGVTGARGWYSNNPDARGIKEHIYVLSPDFVDSGLTVETLLHEITHSVVASLVHEKSAAALPFITDLENLLAVARKHVAALSPQAQEDYAPAISSVQELIAWGMTNQAFQENVLKKITYKTKTWKLVDGMKAFIDAITGILFNGIGNNRKDVATSGMAALINNVSGLFAEAAKPQAKPEATGSGITTLSMAAPSAKIDSYTTHDLFDALGNSSTNPSFDEHLRGLLSGIVSKLHGPFGSFKASVQESAADAWQKAMDTGVAPFASQSRAMGIQMSPQTAYVMEQVEATMLTALDDNEQHSAVAYKELSKLYQEVRSKITAKDFHEGDWASAQPHEQKAAEDLYNFIFKMEKVNGDRTDHLARFAALGLTHPKFHQLLQIATERDTRSLKDMDFNEKLKTIFERVLNWLNGKLTHTTPGQQANQKLQTLVEQLVDIESRKKAMLKKRADQKDYTAPLEEGARKIMETTREKIAQLANTDFVQNNRFAMVKAAGALADTVAQDRVIQLMDTLADFRDKNFKQRHGLMAGLLNSVRGPLQAFNDLLLGAKEHERERKFVITQVSKAILSGFSNAGKSLSTQAKAAMSAVLLRTGAHVLLNHFDMDQLASLVNAKPDLETAIKDFEGRLDSHGSFKKDFLYQARALAYQRVTGQQKSAFGVLNAGNIARLYGTGNTQTISEAQAQQAEPVIDVLVSLYALQYSSHSDKKVLGKLLTTEANGVKFALLVHKELEKQSREKLFAGSEALMTKGHTPEIYNPHTDIKVADAIEGDYLLGMGYTKGALVERDPADPDTTVKHLYVLPDGGMQSYLSGIIAPGSMKAKGSLQHNGNLDILTGANPATIALQRRINTTKQAALRRAIDSTPDFDPTKAVPNFMTPVLNAQGQSVNWRYMMHESTKDSVLERDNRPEEILGALAGSIYDKATIDEKNEKAIQALHDQFQDQFAKRSASFVQVGPNAPDEANREIYRLLPEATKESIKKIWGKEGLQVPVELMDITFGYRKLSLANNFDKVNQNRKAKANDPSIGEFDGVGKGQQAFIWSVEWALKMYARVHLKMDEAKAEHYAKRGAVVVARAERGWQEVVALTKDVIVVRTGTVMVSNILSNFSLLSLQGVSWKEQLHHGRIGLKGVTSYQADNAELFQLKLQLDSGTASNPAETRRKLIELEDALARNPVRQLIEAGLMPTIVEDIGADVDPYSYKTSLVKKLSKYTDKLPSPVRNVGKNVVVAQDTKLYKALSQTTQMSDFVARYTLYQHLTNRKKNPLSHEDAIQQASESFVNYDNPMHRKMQYMDDMGITYFTKYFLGIQRVLLKTTRENPLRVLLALTLNNYFDALPLVTDSSAIAHLGNNPLRSGAFEIFNTGDDLATVNAAMSLLK